MKKIIPVFILISTLLSCSSDSDEIETTPPSNNSFFNINTGNKWVYKSYFFYNLTNEYTSSNRIDSVSVIGDTLINSINYKKIKHDLYSDIINSSNYHSISFSYLRIDGNDHLIDHDAHVLHPGFDSQYQHIHDYYIAGNPSYGLLGQATFQIQTPENILVEGTNYLSYDYKGNVPANPTLNNPDYTIHFMYSNQIGLIKQILPFASGTGFMEDRLVYYSLN